MKTFDCHVIFDESIGECEFFIIKNVADEKEALEKLYEMEPNYKNYKIDLYDITELGELENETI
jgi:hypothetical protein